MNYQQRIKEALENSEQDIAYLAGLNDAKLQKKLRVIRHQMNIATQNGQDEAWQLLQIRERQVIEARIMKYEQHPPLDNMSEGEKELKEMEELERFEETAKKRREILEKGRGRATRDGNGGSSSSSESQNTEKAEDSTEGQTEETTEQLKLF